MPTVTSVVTLAALYVHAPFKSAAMTLSSDKSDSQRSIKRRCGDSHQIKVHTDRLACGCLRERLFVCSDACTCMWCGMCGVSVVEIAQSAIRFYEYQHIQVSHTHIYIYMLLCTTSYPHYCMCADLELSVCVLCHVCRC